VAAALQCNGGVTAAALQWRRYNVAAPLALGSAGILLQCIRARNRVRIGLSYRPDRLHWLVDSIP
jgi:hypothetical protein